uniref:Reverse transcriptase domain-containing protein n=1 Tax=Tanacetum cinerariifolium TaxID=118510 RepID=A0A6L2LWT3_TANCI|nr:reverse transcriptase domain-containing protein [Tanacetum cinerariifolium]
MRTRSSLNLVGETSMNPKCRNRRCSKQRIKLFSLEETPVVTMDDQCTMAELLQAPTEGYGDAIFIPSILEENFKLKHGLLNLVTSKQFYRFKKEDPHAHIRWFNKITSTIKYRDVPNSSIKLMLFPFSIEGQPGFGSKEPPRSILTWEDLAWDCFKDLLRACPHHGFTELHQLDTFYNALTPTDQDSLNVAADDNLLIKTPRDALIIIENKSKVCNSRNKPIVTKVSTNAPSSYTPYFPEIAALADAVKAMILQKSSPPAFVKAVEEICQTQVAHSNELSNYKKINDANMKALQNQINNVKNELRNEMQTSIQTSMSNQTNELKNMMASFFQMNTASSSSLGSLPSNTIANQRGDLKAITTRSSVSYDGPPILPPFSSLPKVVERVPEVTKDTVQPSTKNTQPLIVQTQVLINEPVVAPMPKPTIPYPSRVNKQKLREKDVVDYVVDPWVPLILGRPFLRTRRALIDVYSEELTFRVDDEAITFKVGQTLKYSYNDAESINLIDVIDVACEKYVQEMLGFSKIPKSGNRTPILDPIIALSSPSLTPFEGGDFILEEIEACLARKLIPSGIDDIDFEPKGDILLIEKLLNDDPSSPLPSKELNLEELKNVKSSINDPLELELKDLPSHLEYAFLEGTNKLLIIIDKNLKEDEKVRLLKALKSYKHAIAWKISNIKGIIPQFCTHKILMEDDFKLAIQHQRRVNPKIQEVIKKEVINILDARLIYPISDIPWVSPVHCVPKKGGMTVVTNEDNELIPTRLGTRYLLTYKTKRRPPSLALIEDFPTDVCLSAYVMLRARSKDHSALNYLLAKKDAKKRLLRWILLLQEFNVIIRDKKGAENLAADHLSRLENPHQSDLEKKEIKKIFPLETLRMVTFRGDSSTSWAVPRIILMTKAIRTVAALGT